MFWTQVKVKMRENRQGLIYAVSFVGLLALAVLVTYYWKGGGRKPASVVVTASESEIYIVRSRGENLEVIQCEDFTVIETEAQAQTCPARSDTTPLLIPKEQFRNDLMQAMQIEGPPLPERQQEIPFVEASILDQIAELEQRRERIREFIASYRGITRGVQAALDEIDVALNQFAAEIALRKALDTEALADINAQIEGLIDRVLSDEDNLLQLRGNRRSDSFQFGLLTSYIKTRSKIPSDPLEALLGEFISIEPGTFMMGSPPGEAARNNDEGPQHRVTLTRPFEMQKTEATQAMWVEVMGVNPSHFQKRSHCPDTYQEGLGCPNHPVEQVSWNDITRANGFLDQLNERLKDRGYQYDLPTEAQWEYAARAGTTTPFNLGENITPDQVNYNGNYPYKSAAKGKYQEQTVAVASLPNKNDYGLYDMHGNVWEWVKDWSGAFSALEVRDPEGPNSGSSRVIRGGGWSSFARDCRSAFRDVSRPEFHYGSLGLRLVRTQ